MNGQYNIKFVIVFRFQSQAIILHRITGETFWLLEINIRTVKSKARVLKLHIFFPVPKYRVIS
jgi:hypothetical protein